MSNLRLVKTNFTAGEISPLLLGRGDLRAYENGAKTLQNVTIHPTGGLTRRRGTYYIDTAAGHGRLISFEFNDEQAYLLVLTGHLLTIYRAGLKQLELATPWNVDQIAQITWTQSADVLLLCHPDVPPKKLVRQSDTLWQLNDWSYIADDTTHAVQQPYYKFADDAVTLTPSATTGTITITASQSIFAAGHVNTRLRIVNKEVLITAVLSSTAVTATTIQNLLNTSATADWVEQAFSAARGWPICAAFHQDRLAIGGSRDLPNRLWLSQTGDLWNFDKGTGLDSHAIEFGLFSDQVNRICALFSGRHLQVFTSGAEYIVTGVPLTPANIQLNRQTRIGSVTSRYLPPVDVDGATLFIGKNGREMLEFLYADVEQAYQANDLALLARHFFKDAVDQCFDPLQRVVFLPLENGEIAMLTIYRTESVSAWSRLKTSGKVLSVATVGDSVYLLVKRQNNLIFIERMDETVLLDSALSGTSVNPVSVWSGLEHLNNQTVQIIADGVPAGEKIVTGNQIALDTPARDVVIGLGYTHVIEPLPPSALSTDGQGRTLRLVDATFRFYQTQSFALDTGQGLKNLPLRHLGQNDSLDAITPPFTGDYTVRSFGWQKDNTKNLWRIDHNSPLPFSLLGATMTIKVND